MKIKSANRLCAPAALSVPRHAAITCMAAVLTALLLGGCGGDAQEKWTPAVEKIETAGEEQEAGETAAAVDEEGHAAAGAGETSVDSDSIGDMRGAAADSTDTHSPEEAALKERFGEDCIASQTFEIALNGCEGELWFVPYAPTAENPEFHAQVIRDGEVLAGLSAYVPEEAVEEPFTSLDAVSYWDVNFDGFTDIVLIVSYGDTQFVTVYYGDYFSYSDGSESWSFYGIPGLSDHITAQAARPLTVAGIREFLTGGKRNGEFENYAEAYEAVIRLSEANEDFAYDLIYVDEDAVPELVAGVSGYYVNLYTYQDGTIYTLMDEWGYGAMGNAGYEYAPGENSIRNYNADQAGAIMNTYFMRINAQHAVETPVWIQTYQFIDSNGNGMLDEEETYGEEGAAYVNEKEASEEDLADIYAEYDMGDYQMIIGVRTAAEVRKALQ